MLPREERKRRWERYQQSLVVSYDLSEWYATFRPVERRLFFHSLWSLNEVLYDRDVVRGILEDLIWLWKRKHYSSLEGHRLYRLKETPEHFFRELKLDLARMHYENVEKDRLELEESGYYDPRYLEILYRSNDPFFPVWQTEKYVKKFDIKYREETLLVPPTRSYECIDIRDRQKMWEYSPTTDFDKSYTKKVAKMGIETKSNRLFHFLMKMKDFLQFDPVEMNKNFLGYS